MKHYCSRRPGLSNLKLGRKYPQTSECLTARLKTVQKLGKGNTRFQNPPLFFFFYFIFILTNFMIIVLLIYLYYVGSYFSLITFSVARSNF